MKLKLPILGAYYADHDRAIYPVNGSVYHLQPPIFNQGDPITDLHENMAAEEKQDQHMNGL